MKTTIDLPEDTLRAATIVAARRGVPLRQLFTEAVEEKLRRCAGHAAGSEDEPPWMAGFGALSDLADETGRVLAAIEEEFETVSAR